MTAIWLMKGMSAVRTERCTSACVASARLAPSDSSSSMPSLPAHAAGDECQMMSS